MKAAGTPLPLYRLGLAMEGCATQGEMNANFYATLNRGYTPINSYLGAYSGTCSIVGAGPSLADTYTDLQGDVLAINSAIAFLIDKGVVPRWAMIWDCSPLCEKFAVPHDGITYLVASRCHPSVFERLKDCNVVVWHAAGDNNILDLMRREDVIAKQPCHEPLINGGTAGVTRAIFVATALGYKDVQIFGGDSSYSENGDTHINGSLVKEKDVQVAFGTNPPIFFRTTPEWCAQVEEYRGIYAILVCGGPGVTLDVHGRGMLRCMHELLEAQLAFMGREKFIQHVSQMEVDRTILNEKASEKNEEMKMAERVAA